MLDGLRGRSLARLAVLRTLDLRSWSREVIARHGRARMIVAAGVLVCLGFSGVVEAGPGPTDPAAQREAVQGDRTDQAASRSMDRTRAPDTRSDTAGSPDPADVGIPALPTPTKALPPGHLESGPVAGLSVTQMNNAKAIVWTGVDIGMPRRALVIAVATAMQESGLLNRASEVLPESKRYPHQGTGWDHDSVGLFQQRTSSGWGPVARLMDPAYAAKQFYYALRRVPGWQHMRLTEAAQRVQVSAFPEHYAKHEARATKVVDALTDVD